MATFDVRASYNTLVVSDTLLAKLYFTPNVRRVDLILSSPVQPVGEPEGFEQWRATIDHFGSSLTSMPSNASKRQRRASARSENR